MTEQRTANSHEPVRTPLRRIKRFVPVWAKSSVRETALGYGWASAGQRPDPDFLIIGTKRGGTTSLWYACVEHPDILPMFPSLQQAKSPHFFDLHYDRSLRWYRAHFPTSGQRRRHEKRCGVRPVSGEASPYYMFHPLAAERIAADLPDVKLIVSLRNPVDRVWSHYRERSGSGTESLSFREALEAEEGRLAGESDRIRSQAPTYNSFHHDYSSYLARGRYAEHLRPFVELFGDRLLILRAEDFYADENRELSKISHFLGLPRYPTRPTIHYNKMPSSSLSSSDRKFLVDYYRPHVRELENLLGYSMQWDDFNSA